MKLAAKPGSPAAMMMNGKGYRKKEDAYEGGGGERDKRAIMEGSLSDADYRLDDDGENRRLQSEKKRRYNRRLPPNCVDVAQAHDADDAGKDE